MKKLFTITVVTLFVCLLTSAQESCLPDGIDFTAQEQIDNFQANFPGCTEIEGDVGIIGLRYSVSDSTDVYSLNLDTRFPIGRMWRINPRLRIDYREILADQSTQWNYTPGIRIQFRPGRRWRVDLEAGQQFSRREMATSDLDREARFVYLGYQYFF